MKNIKIFSIIFLILAIIYGAFYHLQDIKKIDNRLVREQVGIFELLYTSDNPASPELKSSLTHLSNLLAKDEDKLPSLLVSIGEVKTEITGRRVKILPREKLPLTYEEVQKLVKGVVRNYIPRPNLFVEESYSRLIASQMFNLNSHTKAKTIKDANSYLNLRDLVTKESGNRPTPRSKFIGESFLAFLLDGFPFTVKSVKELLEYPNHLLFERVTDQSEPKYLNYLEKLKVELPIEELRNQLLTYNKVTVRVRRNINFLFPSKKSDLSRYYSEAVHYLEIGDQASFEESYAKIDALFNKMPSKPDVSINYLFLFSLVFALIIFLSGKVKNKKIRLYGILLFGLILLSLTFRFLNAPFSMNVSITLAAILFFHVYILNVDGSTHTEDLHLDWFFKLSLFFSPFLLNFWSLKVSGLILFMPFLLSYFALTLFYQDSLEKGELTPTALTFLPISFSPLIIALAYILLKIQFLSPLPGLREIALTICFYLAITTWAFLILRKEVFLGLMKELILPFSALLLFLAEFQVFPHLFIGESIFFWAGISLFYLLTGYLPLIWSLVLTRAIILLLFELPASPFLLLPFFLVMLVVGILELPKYLRKINAQVTT